MYKVIREINGRKVDTELCVLRSEAEAVFDEWSGGEDTEVVMCHKEKDKLVLDKAWCNDE